MSNDPRDLFKDLKPGEAYAVGPEEFVGSMPVRTELAVLPAPIGPSIGHKEWEEHECCLVYVPNAGPLNSDWTLAEGGTLLIRACDPAGGWWMVELCKGPEGWFVMCGDTKVPLKWNDKRACWVSMVRV